MGFADIGSAQVRKLLGKRVMMRKLLRQPLTFGHAAVLVLVVAVVGGGAFAVAAIPGPDGRIKACVKKSGARKGAVRVIDHKRACSRRERTLSWNQQGPQGAPGAPGTPGTAGAPGQPGEDGPAGSPDTPAQVLAKVKDVDGTGSGLNADQLDGADESEFLRASRIKLGFEVIHDDATTDTILSSPSLRIRDDGGVDTDRSVVVDRTSTFGNDLTVVQTGTGAPQTVGGGQLVLTTTDNFLQFYVRGAFGEDHFVTCVFRAAGADELVICQDVNGTTGF
jgi:hypothetical protein